MFNRVLIAEDQQSMNSWVQQTLKDLDIKDIQYAYYCDDALIRLKNELQAGTPFELLITDLSFLDDGREQMIYDGADLIRLARDRQPELKVLVFSAEPNPSVVSGLFQQLDINGYVHKGRTDTADLRTAIETIQKGKKYIPAVFQQAVRQKNTLKFSNYDIAIIGQLAQGTRQKEIPDRLKQLGMKATGLSSIEKRLNQIRTSLGFTKNEQLIVYCKDRKII